MLFRALYWLFVLISPAGTGKLVEMERNSRDTTLRGYQRRTVSLAQRFAHAYCPLATTAEIPQMRTGILCPVLQKSCDPRRGWRLRGRFGSIRLPLTVAERVSIILGRLAAVCMRLHVVAVGLDFDVAFDLAVKPALLKGEQTYVPLSLKT
jgi:hypothetical protein